MAEYESLVERVTNALHKAQLKYVIVGGFAAIFRGRPRTTTDLDVIIEADHSKIKIFLEALKQSRFNVIDDQVALALQAKKNISIFDESSILRVDLKLARELDEIEVLNQSVTELYKGMAIEVASTEQVLYGKILYLGDISNIPDSELLEYSDVVDFLVVFHQAQSVNIQWLKTKAQSKGLEKTFQRLKELSNKLDSKEIKDI